MADGQLSLGFGYAPAQSRADFVLGACNRDAVAAVDAWPNWASGTLLLTGPAGSGKTHLAGIWAAEHGAHMISATALGHPDWIPPNDDAPVAVEDIGAASEAETNLFHFINEARERGATLLLTSRDPAVTERLKLPDLVSRIRAAHSASLRPPDDEFLGRVLAKLFSDRQLVAPSSLLEFLVRRMERSYAAAARLVEAIDVAALGSQRPLGRQLAASVLEEIGAAGERRALEAK